MMPTGEFLLPYVISQLLALLILVWAILKWRIARWALSLIFLYAGVYNIYIGVVKPDEYLGFREYALPVYKQFIDGAFRRVHHILIPAIGFAQFTIGVMFTMKGKWFLFASVGATIFLLAIIPLMFGAGFPFSLIMILTIWVVWKNNDHSSLWHIHRTTSPTTPL